jgi:hypothetical protein
VKRRILALAGAISLASALPALAATSINVPLVASAPSLDPHAGAAFTGGAVAPLTYIANGGQNAGEPASVRLLSDGKALYVRFDVTQQFEPLEGFDGGDAVAVDLWDAGGEHYHLGTGLNGKHTLDSTANTADWQTAVMTRSGGYTVTMQAPIVTTASLRVQFSRWIAATGEEQVWSHDPSQPADDELAQAGTLIFASSVGKNE